MSWSGSGVDENGERERFVLQSSPVRCLTIAEFEGTIAGAGFEIVETGLLPASPPSRYGVARKP
jgi:hypothetical protein